MLALNLTDAIIRHAVTLRKAVIDETEQIVKELEAQAQTAPTEKGGEKDAAS